MVCVPREINQRRYRVRLRTAAGPFSKTYVSDYDRWGPRTGAGGGWCRPEMSRLRFKCDSTCFLTDVLVWLIQLWESVCLTAHRLLQSLHPPPCNPSLSDSVLYGLVHLETGSNVFPVILMRAAVIPLKYWLFFFTISQPCCCYLIIIHCFLIIWSRHQCGNGLITIWRAHFKPDVLLMVSIIHCVLLFSVTIKRLIRL